MQMPPFLLRRFISFFLLQVVASRSFQPDPWMVTLLLASVFAILRYDEAPSRSRLAIAAVVSSLAFVVSPGRVCALLGACVALAIGSRGVGRASMRRTLLVCV